MSSVINFLERVGQDAQLNQAANEDLRVVLDSTQMSAHAQLAILSADHKALELLLNARTEICCGMAPGKHEEEDEEEPSKDDDEITAQSAIVCLA